MTKKNLILIHGWGFNQTIWDFNQEYLNILTTKYNYNIIKLDLYDIYKNIEYPNITIDIFLDKIIDYLNISKPKQQTHQAIHYDILGWSLGGIIALNLKHKYPNLINKIILCASTPCFINNNTDNNIWLYGVTEQNWNKFCDNLFNNYSKTIKEFILLQVFNTKDYKIIYKNLLGTYKINDINNLYKQYLQFGLDILKNNYINILDKLDNNKINFILGAKDSLVNKDITKYLEQNHPNINYNILSKSAHMPFISEPDLFYKTLIDFLENKNDHK